MHIKGWVKSTLLDYPGRIAASLFCGGCNFRCPNCHNADIVLYPDQIRDVSQDEIREFLQKRRGLLDGIAISGGEPTLQPDLSSFCAGLHEMGFLVKLDTNGYRPDVIRSLIDAGLVDYVAMDVKAPLRPAKYAQAAGVEADITRIERSVDLLLEGGTAYEFRTTVVPGILDEEDIAQIARDIAGAQHYYLQQFVPRDTLDPAMLSRRPYLPDRVRSMAELARPWVKEVGLRGV
jgi:pyruvate formate lyase activating enzyme